MTPSFDGSLEIAEVALRFVNPFTTSYQTRTEHRVLLARRALGDGRFVFGEASPYYGETLDTIRAALRAWAEGRRRRDPNAWREAFGAAGERHPSAAALLDLLDVHAIEATQGRTTSDLFARHRATFPLGAAAWMAHDPPRATHTSMTIGLDTVEVMARKARDAAAFRILKVKLGRGPEHDLAAMRAVREAAPDARLTVDANAAWPLEVAIPAARELLALGVEFLEQPMARGRLADVAALRRAVPMPLVADEDFRGAASVADLAAAGYDGVNVKLMKIGGLNAAVDAIVAARASGLRILVGCMIETSIAQTAAARLAPWSDYCDLDATLLTANDPCRGLEIAPDGRLQLPDLGPGGALPRADAALDWLPIDR